MDTKFLTNPFAMKWRAKLQKLRKAVMLECEQCYGVGFITKTEWTDTDTSYEVEVKCVCQEE